MQINFYPESDNPNFEKAAKEYTELWKKEGEKITATIEKISGLKFREKVINALIYSDISYSSPLQLQAAISLAHKKGTIVHELCHRLLVANKIKWEKIKGKNGFNLLAHRPVDLILYDIWVELYGKNFAKKEVVYEISLWSHGGVSPYKIAWDWALGMTKTERHEEFLKYLQK